MKLRLRCAFCGYEQTFESASGGDDLPLEVVRVGWRLATIDDFAFYACPTCADRPVPAFLVDIVRGRRSTSRF